MNVLVSLLILLRPHQYVKNAFVFAPWFFAFHFPVDSFLSEGVVFLLFSALASSVYILNDIKDINEDREHPTKKNRPLPSGKISMPVAWTLFASLSSLAFVAAWFFSVEVFLVLVVYFILNLAYSFGLKHVSILDIFIIATGFVLRLFAGNAVLDQNISMWIVIVTFLLALFLALAKRRDDVLLAGTGKKTRKNIDGYNLEFVNAAMVLMAAVVIVAYILYTVTPEVTQRFQSGHVYLTAFFVVLGIFRYMQITFVHGDSGSPTKVVLKDIFLQLTILLWLGSLVLVYTLKDLKL